MVVALGITRQIRGNKYLLYVALLIILLNNWRWQSFCMLSISLHRWSCSKPNISCQIKRIRYIWGLVEIAKRSNCSNVQMDISEGNITGDYWPNPSGIESLSLTLTHTYIYTYTGGQEFIGSKVQCLICSEYCTTEGRGEKREGVQMSKNSTQILLHHKFLAPWIYTYIHTYIYRVGPIM